MQDILKLIRERQSMRIPFDPDRPVSREDMLKILEAARWTPTAHNMQNFEIIVVDDREILSEIWRVERPISETFIRENYRQLSFSVDELKKKKTGILSAMFPPSWLDPHFTLKEGDVPEMRAFPDTPALIVVLYDPSVRAPASDGDFLGIISLGCAMENMWLMAHSLGLGFHIISSLGAEPAADEVKKILNIPEHLKVAFTCRVGYPVSTPAENLRVRRDVEDFAHHNGFGKRFEEK